MSDVAIDQAIFDVGWSLNRSDDALKHLTCAEFQPIADLLALAGHPELAIDLIVNHAHGDDDEGDQHHDVYLAIREDGDAHAAAAEWI
jgi:hypothetical protein